MIVYGIYYQYKKLPAKLDVPSYDDMGIKMYEKKTIVQY